MTAQIQLLQAQLARQPNDPGLYYELGRCYLAQQQPQEADMAFQQALRLAPDHPQILMQLGNVASLAGDEVQASRYFTASLQQDAAQPDVHFNLGNSLRKQGQCAQAIQHYLQAIRLQPQDADYHNNLGNAYREAGELALAVQAYEAALRIAPGMLHAKVHWIHQKQHMADWQGLAPAIEEVRQALQQDAKAQIPPFAFLAMPGTTDAEQTRCASAWAQQQFGHVRPLPPPAARLKTQKIRLAYLSSDFRNHPLTHLVTDAIAAHDRQRFEVHLYSQAKTEDSAAQRQWRQVADHWYEISPMTDDQVASHMRETGIDILIDLTGYTQNSRSGIAAYRPARHHINWLGYPGSMGYLHGQPLFDAIIVDDTLKLPALAERPILLPCYQPNNAQRPLAEAGTRAEHGLPEQAFVFCNFNQSFKITEAMFGTWMQILHAVPHSVLWLLESNRWATEHLRQAASDAGIAIERLIFAPRTEIARHIARQQHADLMLDTQPYNAHTTASDALFMGVPILTLEGTTFSARVTASLLRSIGIETLICQEIASYQREAIRLANEREFTSSIRSMIMKNKEKIFNPIMFCHSLEQALSQLLD